jgi:hypothetical protein
LNRSPRLAGGLLAVDVLTLLALALALAAEEAEAAEGVAVQPDGRAQIRPPDHLVAELADGPADGSSGPVEQAAGGGRDVVGVNAGPGEQLGARP